MSSALSMFLAQVDYLIAASDGELAEAARQAMIKAAVETYSIDRPDTQVDDVTGDAGRYYDLADKLSAWSEGFSRVLRIEYPAATVASDEAPIYLDPEDWQDDYWADNVRYLYLPRHAPAATESMRITYTVPWVWSGDPEVTTTPVQDFYAICHLAAANCCRAIAAKYSRTNDSTLGADSVAHVTRADMFGRRAKEFQALYREHLGLDGGDGKGERASGTFVDWDTAPEWPSGRQYVFHRNR